MNRESIKRGGRKSAVPMCSGVIFFSGVWLPRAAVIVVSHMRQSSSAAVAIATPSQVGSWVQIYVTAHTRLMLIESRAFFSFFPCFFFSLRGAGRRPRWCDAIASLRFAIARYTAHAIMSKPNVANVSAGYLFSFFLKWLSSILFCRFLLANAKKGEHCVVDQLAWYPTLGSINWLFVPVSFRLRHISYQSRIPVARHEPLSSQHNAWQKEIRINRFTC